MAVRNVVERAMAASGLIPEAEVRFGRHDAVQSGGVLLAVPALLGHGLLEASGIYEPFPAGYYGLEQVLMLLGFMALLRIKCPEQLKGCQPGELGKVLGLDRAPEAKTLRRKIGLLVSQQKADEYQRALLEKWTQEDPCAFFYVDGHVRVYNGSEANLGKKYVSRQKLCLAGTTEYWVNDGTGLPLMCVVGQLNEKLREAIEHHIVPQLLRDAHLPPPAGPDEPRLTLVFDREAYEPAFFARLWDNHRIAVVTYRKNMKDKWPEDDFHSFDTQVIGNNVSMRLCERAVTLGGHQFREVRRLNEGGHQVGILTTHPGIGMAEVAGRVFSRWSQENFFRYMLQDYGFDRLLQYGTEELPPETVVVNPAYSRLSQKIKKENEKMRRLQARMHELVEREADKPIEDMAKFMAANSKTTDAIKAHKDRIEALTAERAAIPARIKIKDMPEGTRYNKLKTESKMLINIVRMVAYRAETAMLNLIMPHYNNSQKDGRMLVKSILSADADIIPDNEAKTLTVVLHTQATPRGNEAAKELCKIMTDTEVVYPGTNLRMIFKTHSSQSEERQ